MQQQFQLDKEFVQSYKDRPEPWGFGDLSYVVYKRTYARPVEGEGRTEEWFETCERVINGMFTVQKRHCKKSRLPWSDKKAQKTAQDAYDRLFQLKWSPAGRGLRMMGTEFAMERTSAALQSCAFISTEFIGEDFSEPFGWLLEMSMLGIGVGFDTKGAGKVQLKAPDSFKTGREFIVEDSREGWRAAVETLLNSFIGQTKYVERWNFDKVRPKGAIIKSFGGVASGPGPLKDALETIEGLCKGYIGKPVDSAFIVDVMNIIGRCVVAGGQRRSAMLALGDREDDQFMDLKLDQDKLMAWRWASNNSIFAVLGMDYRDAAKRTAANGEPNYFWLENARAYGRLKDPPNFKDADVIGCNPCAEQTLHHKELCNLVENYPARHDSFEDFEKTLKVSYLYAKTVTLLPTHDEETNSVMARNRRIGASLTGVVQAINKLGYREFFTWCDYGYGYLEALDRKYSDWLGIPRSIKITSIKPSGSISLLSGSTPGCHWGFAPFYIRRVRVAKGHELIPICKAAGYKIEDCAYAPDTAVIEFPVKIRDLDRSEADVSAWEKVNLAADLQYYWADNAVSCTIAFDRESEANQIPKILEAYETRLKGISFLPLDDHGYAQPPYERITEEEYLEAIKTIKPIRKLTIENDLEDKFCDGPTCEIKP